MASLTPTGEPRLRGNLYVFQLENHDRIPQQDQRVKGVCQRFLGRILRKTPLSSKEKLIRFFPMLAGMGLTLLTGSRAPIVFGIVSSIALALFRDCTQRNRQHHRSHEPRVVLHKDARQPSRVA